MRFLVLILLTFSVLYSSQAQNQLDLAAKEEKLVQLANQFLQDSIKENRITAATSFSEMLAKSLQEKESFHYPFQNLEAVSILYPADSTFRIFTWQLYIDKNDYRYGGLIQVNNAENKLFSLTDLSKEVATYDIEYDVLSPEDWYGAIYFNIQDYDTKDGKKYLLFGFDGYQFFNKRKVVEAFYFDESGLPVFGAPSFAKTAEGYEASTKNRLYLEYSSEVAARLNYDPNLEMIILDNLVSMRSPYKSAGNVNIPDGSYIGYKLNNGVWEHIDKVFNLVSEKPPAPRRVFNENNTQKDIFVTIRIHPIPRRSQHPQKLTPIPHTRD